VVFSFAIAHPTSSAASFSLVEGIIALTMGLGEFFGLKLPLFAIVLIVIGVAIFLKMLLETDSIPPLLTTGVAVDEDRRAIKTEQDKRSGADRAQL
jgi:hypothetical protein